MDFDIEEIKRKLLVKCHSFASILANVDYKADETIKTAATDGKVIYYNPNYLAGLSVDEQVFVLAHEVFHIALNHIYRSKGKHAKTWNIATDAIINDFLRHDGLKMVERAVDIADARDYDAEELYDKLMRERQSDQKQSEKNGDFTSSESQDAGHDSHDMWEEAVEKRKEESSTEAKEQEEREAVSEKAVFKKILDDKKKALEELKKTLLKQALSAASTGSVRETSDIGRSAPLIDWRYVLREAISHDVDWSYKNATIEEGVISANLEEYLIPQTEILIDTSGSIDKELLKNFLQECKNILKHSRLKVGCFDTKFYGFHEIRTEEDIENMKFEGGGGTDFEVAIRAFTNRVENKIIFTDGDADMPDIPFEAIWIVFGGINITPRGGKVIQIDKEQLDRLRFGDRDRQSGR